MSEARIWRAGVGEADAAARLFHDFNAEFGEPTPDVPTQTKYLAAMLAAEEATILLAGEGPDGFSMLRLRTSPYTGRPEAYLQELYVVPARRGQGLGRALLEASIEAARGAGATFIDLNTGETDTEARGLYESSGFTNREGGPDGPTMLYYEREI